MSSQKKKGSFDLLRFAKQVEGLHTEEKAALVDIADAAGQLDGYCSKSIETMAKEHGHNERGLRHGLYGRARKNNQGENREIFPGIVKRGLVYAEGSTTGGLKPDGHGITNVWRVNVPALLPFLKEEYQQKLTRILQLRSEQSPAPNPEPSHAPKGAQPGASGADNFPIKHFLKEIPGVTSQPTAQPNSQSSAEGGSDDALARSGTNSKIVGQEIEQRLSFQEDVQERAAEKNIVFSVPLPEEVFLYVENLDQRMRDEWQGYCEDYGVIHLPDKDYSRAYAEEAVLNWLDNRSFEWLSNPNFVWTRMPDEIFGFEAKAKNDYSDFKERQAKKAAATQQIAVEQAW